MNSIEEADAVDADQLAEWARLRVAVTQLLDQIAGLPFDTEALPELTDKVEALSERLGEPVGDPDILLRSLHNLPSRGRFAIPPFELTKITAEEVEGTVYFGRRHVGRNNAAHGGAVAMVFDEALGGVVNQPGQPRCRTAKLETNYRSITPIGKPLTMRAKITGREGRKLYAIGEIFDGETLCADANGLFIVLRPGQP